MKKFFYLFSIVFTISLMLIFLISSIPAKPSMLVYSGLLVEESVENSSIKMNLFIPAKLIDFQKDHYNYIENFVVTTTKIRNEEYITRGYLIIVFENMNESLQCEISEYYDNLKYRTVSSPVNLGKNVNLPVDFLNENTSSIWHQVIANKTLKPNKIDYRISCFSSSFKFNEIKSIFVLYP